MIASAKRASGTVVETVLSVLAGSVVSVTDRRLQVSIKKKVLLEEVYRRQLMTKLTKLLPKQELPRVLLLILLKEMR